MHASIWRQNDLKSWVTSQNYKSDQITMNCIDLTLLRKTFKTTQNYKSDQITMNCIDLTLLRKTFKTTQNYKSNQITMDCIDFTSKQSKMLSYVVKHSKLRKTTKVIKLQWISSIRCQNIKPTQNYRSDLISMNLHRFDIKTIKTTQIYESHQITMNCIDLTSNDLKCSVTSQNIQNNAKLQKWSNYNELHRFDVETI